jgi:hypothetical protein
MRRAALDFLLRKEPVRFCRPQVPPFYKTVHASQNSYNHALQDIEVCFLQIFRKAIAEPRVGQQVSWICRIILEFYA